MSTIDSLPNTPSTGSDSTSKHMNVRHTSSQSSSKQLPAILRVAAGAFAGCLSRTALAPIDRVKILYQTNAKRQFKFSKAWKTSAVILRDEGIRGFYKGNGASVLRVAPYAATIFTTFDFYEDTLAENFKLQHGVATRFCAGSLAGMTAVTLTYPLDLLRTRIAATWGQLEASSTTTRSPASRPVFASNGVNGSVWLRTLSGVVKESGFMGLFAGLRPTLVGIIPYSGLNFTLYIGLKELVMRKSQTYSQNRKVAGDSNLAVMINLSCGGLAGLIAQTFTYPLHVIRRRQQMGGLREVYLLRNCILLEVASIVCFISL